MSKEIDLISLPKKSFWKLSLPIIAFCLFDAIYTIVDMVWVSRISVEAFFALGVSIPAVALIFSFGDSVGRGTNSIMSRFIGSGDYESSYNALIHGIILSHIMWVLTVLCLLFANGILFYLDKADSYILIFDYLVPIVVFSYLFIFVNMFSETLQAEGNSTLPSALIISSNVLNIILDPIFIFTFNLGIKGAAYATVVSGLVAFIIIIYYYLSGKTKVPLSVKYFKFRPYIIAEIFKVALPNLLESGLGFFSISFINSVLIATTGEMGPILYAASNKLKTLLLAPVRGYGRGLMSVTGHLFGARKFDELMSMFKYALNVSLITMFIIMCLFFLVRDYVFGLFSITGMDNIIFWIGVLGTVIMLAIPVSMISSKMLDGLGKSVYSLIFTFLKVIFGMLVVYVLSFIFTDGGCVLIGILISEVVFAIVYYLFLNHQFKNFDEVFREKSTVKTFDDENISSDYYKEPADTTPGKYQKTMLRIPLVLALMSLATLIFEIISLPVRLHNYSLIAYASISFVIGVISIYLMERMDKPKISSFGFILNAVLIFAYLGKYGNLSTLMFTVSGILVLYIRLIILKLKRLKNMVVSDEE
ncbi:MATE family efflux transporter [Methanobrevibacter sp.]